MKARLMFVLALTVHTSLAGWLGTLGTGKREALQRFISENYSKDVLARGSAQQRAAGGGFSTAEDLIRFARALRGHRLLGPKLTELVLAGKVDTASRRK